jgi:uncharacterized spore protein YtfJ
MAIAVTAMPAVLLRRDAEGCGIPIPTKEPSMTIDQLINGVRDVLTVGRVFGEPYERDGVTVIPAASVRGAGGGGGGKDEHGQEGDGGGFLLTARPAGAYVVKDGEVTWQPAVDVNRIVLVAVLGWVTAVRLLAAIARRRRG